MPNGTIYAGGYIYDIPTNGLGNMPGGANFSNLRSSSVAYDGHNHIYFAGGLDAGNSPVSLVSRYNLTTGLLETLPPMPFSSNSAVAMFAYGELIVYLGNSEGAYQNKLCILRGNKWRVQDLLPGEIHGLTHGVQVGNELILVGGFNGAVRHSAVSKLRIVKD